MKTRNTNRKTIAPKPKQLLAKSAAVVFSLLLISFTVSAQGFWKEFITKSSFGKIAQILAPDTEMLASSSTASTRSAAKSSYLYAAPVQEEPLEVETWMSDDNYFGAEPILLEKNTDKPLKLEDWMANESYFSKKQTPTEKALKLEDWMTSNNYWRM